MNDAAWTKWVLQSARTWDDVSDMIRPMGIDILDEEHEKFTQLVLDLNQLLEVFHCQDSKFEALGRGEALLQDLIDYAQNHFSREERMMQEQGVPAYGRHKAQHDYFVAMIERYMKDFRGGMLNFSVNLKLDLLEWWIHHINGMDYISFVKGGKGDI